MGLRSRFSHASAAASGAWHAKPRPFHPLGRGALHPGHHGAGGADRSAPQHLRGISGSRFHYSPNLVEVSFRALRAEGLLSEVHLYGVLRSSPIICLPSLVSTRVTQALGTLRPSGFALSTLLLRLRFQQSRVVPLGSYPVTLWETALVEEVVPPPCGSNQPRLPKAESRRRRRSEMLLTATS